MIDEYDKELKRHFYIKLYKHGEISSKTQLDESFKEKYCARIDFK